MKINVNGETEKAKHKIDPRSLKFKLTLYFVLFAVSLMAILWLLQIAFLNSYYEVSMQKQVKFMVNALGKTYSQSEILDLDSLYAEIWELSFENDTYFYLETADGLLRITSSIQADGPGRMFVGGAAEMEKAKELVLASADGTIHFYVEDQGRKSKTLVYASIAESSYREDLFIYAFAPLYPVDTTVNILARQLLLVTVVSLTIAGILAFWLSTRLSKPLTNIKNKAELLAEGNYNVTFEGGHYTEINDLANTLTYTAEELSKADNLQKDLLANVSHDLRTPLTMVKSYAELVRDISGNNEAKRNEHLGVIVEEADRLDALVGDILTLSKIQSGVDVMKKNPVDIQKLTEGVLSTYKVLEEQEGYTFEFNRIPGNVIVHGDERRLSQVLYNLISNSVQYSGQIKDIKVTIEAENGKMKLSVIDKGIGIPALELESIWNRYHRASKQNSRVLSGGSGLGLSITKEILQLHNAEFGVESEEGKGSVFWFMMNCEISY